MVDFFLVNYFTANRLQNIVSTINASSPTANIYIIDNSNNDVEYDFLNKISGFNTKIFHARSNIGFGAACNILYEKSNSEYIFLLNPDIHLNVDCIPTMLLLMQNNPRIAACSPKQYWDSSLEWLLPPAWLPTGIDEWALTYANYNRNYQEKLSFAYQNLSKNLWLNPGKFIFQKALSGSALLIRRSVAQKVGGLFDSNFFMYYEDSDLCLRLRNSGLSMAISTESYIIHDFIHNENKIRMMEESKLMYFEKHFNHNGQWKKRLQKLNDAKYDFYMFDFKPLPTTSHHMKIPNQLANEEWFCEISPSPLLIPSITKLGKGPILWIDFANIKKLLGNLNVYMRISKLNFDRNYKSHYFIF